MFADGDLLLMSVPCPHAMLLSEQLWDTYALPVSPLQSKVKLGYHLIPALDSLAARIAKTVHPPAPLVPLPTSSLSEIGDTAGRLANFLREHAPLILARTDGPETSERTLKQWVAWADNLEDMLGRDGPVTMTTAEEEQLARLRLLLQTVSLSGVLLTSDNMDHVIQLSITVALPRHLSKVCLAEWQSIKCKPLSLSTRRHHRLTLALAYWAALQQEHLGNDLHYELCDSSPQCGWDYFLRSCVVVRAASVLEAFKLSLFLAQPLAARSGGMSRDDALEKLVTLIQRRSGFPTTVGSGRAGAGSKLACMLHSLRMETPSWVSAVQAANQTISLTTDWGTESNFTALQPVSLTKLFPWLHDEQQAFTFVSDTVAPQVPLVLAEDVPHHLSETSVSLHGALAVPGAFAHLAQRHC